MNNKLVRESTMSKYQRIPVGTYQPKLTFFGCDKTEQSAVILGHHPMNALGEVLMTYPYTYQGLS
jgi:hypothetical protein